MKITKYNVALAGNPNSGKSTLFNQLTGSNQYVGNWPGVTIDKKEGYYRKNKEIGIIDLPGIYSLSPYSPEEVISRDYLLDYKVDVVVNVVDGTNLERNLYLTTQLAEIGIPVVVALNMMDVTLRRGDKLDSDKLSTLLGLPCIPVSALKGKGMGELMAAVMASIDKTTANQSYRYLKPALEAQLEVIEKEIAKLVKPERSRWYAIKYLENDTKALEHAKLNVESLSGVDGNRKSLLNDAGDDGESLVATARYDFVTDIVKQVMTKVAARTSMSERVDKVLTNRFLALPIFALIMFGIYFISVQVVGSVVTDFVNEDLIGGLQGLAGEWLEGLAVAPWLVALVVDGIIGGVGAPLGFLPQIATLFLFLALLEEVGYMARIAFILDRIFRKFGMSGKSFIPILIGTGCAVPGIMGTRTIENVSDRRMTIICASFLPCTAKAQIILLFASSFFAGMWWFAGVAYFAGLAAVIVSGVILKKFGAFSGETTPFVMELPEYRMPRPFNVLRTLWDRIRAFVVKAGTLIFLVVVILWLLENISVQGQFFDFEREEVDSLLMAVGKFVAPLFIPLGFGNWIPAVATFAGIGAKEIVVSTMGVFAKVGEDLSAADPSAIEMAQSLFTPISAISFMIFNQLNIPCQACIGATVAEMKSWKWSLFTFAYQTGFAYVISMIIYQFGLLMFGGAFTVTSAIAIAFFVLILVLLFRRGSKVKA